jgi:hypothetical protein
MGIRVKKVIGWGINTLNTEVVGEGPYPEVVLKDPRFNINPARDEKWESTYAEFLDWVEAHCDRVGELVALNRHRDPLREVKFWVLMERNSIKRGLREEFWCPGHGLVYEDEGGEPNTLMVCPPDQYGPWFRRNCTIDWVEETQHHGQSPRSEYLTGCGIFPYSSGWIRFRDPSPGMFDIPEGGGDPGTRWDDLGPTVLDPASYSMLVGTWGDFPALAKTDEKLRHLREDWRPPTPVGVLAVLAYFEDCFSDLEAFVHELRPMLYVFWS